MRDCQSKSISMKLLAFKEKLCSEINKSPKKWKLNEWTSIKQLFVKKKRKWKLHHSQSGIILRCLQKFVIHLEANSIAISWPRRRLCRILLEKKGFSSSYLCCRILLQIWPFFVEFISMKNNFSLKLDNSQSAASLVISYCTQKKM